MAANITTSLVAWSFACLAGAAATLAATPPNDACGSAVDHWIGPAGGLVTGSVVDATPDGAGCGSNRLPGPDVYHSFIPATRGPWRFDLCNTESGWDTVLSVHRHPSDPAALACPTSSANRVAGGCDDDGCNPFFGQVPSVIRAVSLEPGVRYTVRIGGFDGASVTDAYQLAVTDLNVPNDRCEDAGQAAISGSGGLVFGELTNATTDGSVDAAACLGSARAGSVRDVYHLFTPATSGRWTFTTCIAGVTWPGDTVVSIHTGCPASAANAVACNNDGCEAAPGSSVVSADLVAGVTYRIRVAEYIADRFNALLGTPQYALSVTGEPMGRCCSTALGVCEVIEQSACTTGSFTPGATCSPLNNGDGSCAAGTYNECSQAVGLTLGVPVTASTSGLTGSALATCSSLAPDGWFTFTAPFEGIFQLSAQPAMPMLGLVVSVFPGAACPGAPGGELDCGFVFGDGPKFPVAAGQSVKIRVAATGPGRYTLRVSPSPDEPPAHDLCPDAAVIDRDVALPGTFAGTTGGMSVDSCSSGRRDVWYRYTPPASGRARITVTPAPGGFLTTALSVSTTCDSAAMPLACAGEPGNFEQPTELIFPAAAGTAYRIRVSTNFDAGDFTILVTDAPAGPTNDACAAAAPLTLGDPAAGSTRFAEGSAGAIGVETCSAATSPDSWFSFLAPATGAYQVTVTPNTPTDAGVGIGLFSSCPSNMARDLACVGVFAPGLPNSLGFLAAASTEYRIRVSTYAGEASDFSIVVSPSPTPLGACCLRGGGCWTLGPDECVLFGGSYRGDGVVCESAACPPMGRCCFAHSSTCTVTSPELCTGPGAAFTAGGACYPVECPAGTPPANDLCTSAPILTLPAEVLTALDLADAEGPAIPAGYCGTSESYDLGLDRSVYYRFVAPSSGTLNFDPLLVDFPEPMIVLYRGDSCAGLLDVDCTYRFQAGELRSFEVVGGQTYYLGLGIRNNPDLVNQGGMIRFSLSMDAGTGACCRDTACTVETAGSCGGSGAFQGPGTLCGDPGNPTTCCPANINGAGGVTVQDIFDFLAAYFTGGPAGDFNSSGATTVQDIFDFLAAYFRGCA